MTDPVLPPQRRIGLLVNDEFTRHANSPGHPECPDRITHIEQALEAEGLLSECERIDPIAAARQTILMNHSLDHFRYIETFCRTLPHPDIGEDTSVGPESFAVAMLAAGSVCACVDQVMTGKIRSAFAAVRPPGHHAEYDKVMGFCLFNNIAIAARHAQLQHKVERIFIVDWDVHHGNGTQHSFEEDSSVFFCSIHSDPATMYPGSGFAHERGFGLATGTTLNLPLPTGSREAEYRALLDQQIVPAIESFKPGLILVSAGFDGHKHDPLGDHRLEDQSYYAMTRSLVEVAQEVCDGRIVSALEGGYNLKALARSVVNHVMGLVG